jgi:hypothetical protein
LAQSARQPSLRMTEFLGGHQDDKVFEAIRMTEFSASA